MEQSVVVALTYAVDQKSLDRLQSVSSRITLLPIGNLVREEYLLTSQGKEGTNEYTKVKEKLDSALSQAEVLFLWRDPKNLSTRIPNVKWVQLMGVGTDNLGQRELSRVPATITHAAGNTSRPIAEYVIGSMLYFVKRMSELLDHQRERIWDRSLTLSGLANKTIGIVGLGNIGREVAHLAQAFNMQTLATRYSTKTRQENVEGVDILYPVNEIDQLLASSDFVALTLPLTPESANIINAERIQLMKNTSYLINVSRGKLVDEIALTQALKEKQIAGAALDVFAEEPLSKDSDLWGLPNALISSHLTGNVDTWVEGTIEIFARNLQRYLSNEPLENIVDTKST